MITVEDLTCGENTICDFDEDGKRGCLCKSDDFEGDPYGAGCSSALHVFFQLFGGLILQQ